MNLKVGDKVRVKSEKEIKKLQDENGHINDCYFSQNMFEFCEKEFLINKKADEWFSFSAICDWAFTEDMFTKVDEVKGSKNLTNDKIMNGLCDVIDAKDAEFKKAVREGIVKLELRDKLLNIFNVVVED